MSKILYTIDGVALNMSQQAKRHGLTKSIVFKRLRRGWTPENAFKTPSNRFQNCTRQYASEYNSYRSAKQRCNDANCRHYFRYGGRGIRFRFANFDQFMEAIGPRPVGHELDRIDNDGHYELGNIRWATRLQNCNNRRSNVYINIEGHNLTMAEADRMFNHRSGTVRQRLFRGWSIHDACKRPTR